MTPKDIIDGYRPFIVGLGGTQRPNSTSEKAARLTLKHAEKAGAKVEMLAGPDLIFPMYDPAVTERTENAVHMIETLRKADGIVLSSPSYHGSISGLLKNALDYTEDMRSDKKVYFGGRVVGCIGCGAGWQGAASTVETLRSIAHALRGVPTSIGGLINTAEPVFDGDGNCIDPRTDEVLRIMAIQMVKLARMRYVARAADPDWEHWVKTDERIPVLYR
ncbi:NAD(P)H-dependent oxidoreductase [Mameliella alba]|nr:NAD(P)H-dependent oxidoreductase [Antarctobacter heliothermus]MBY6144457.1 NAD(P)H-dependent oxidoreductase [Mameliella alba]MBY6163519.1 NAD(P)H-dependent oxidoreductase [Mameliella alba]MBY6171782.1 NAD(P)H-dependent oxidoreductase [Mameliella alba]MBY6177007.1 NAD(P)H-dependent oxidoreductase [Mameliella alba]